jgi:hypothetical protein
MAGVKEMCEITLHTKAVDVLRYLASKFPDRVCVEFLRRDEITEQTGVNDQQYNQFMALFENRGWVKVESFQCYAELVYVQSAAVDAVHQLDHQPPRNYWKKLITWWCSSPWRVAISVLAFVIPACWQWVEMLMGILRWIGMR